LKSEGKITEQERRKFAGITAPKGPPKERIKHINILMEELKDNLKKTPTTIDDRSRRGRWTLDLDFA
jgi:hypothetical protein